MSLPQYKEEPEKDCIVTFGVSGWSSSFNASLPLDWPIEKLIETCDRKIPDHIRKTHPANEKLKWIKIYRIAATLNLTQEEKVEDQAEGSGTG